MCQRLIIALVILPLLLLSDVINTPNTVKGHPYFDAAVTKHYDSINQIKEWFQKREVPISSREISTKNQKFLFVTAYPYSGANSLDLYCYRLEDTVWSLCALVFITQSKSFSVDIQQEAKYLNVLHDQVSILKISKEIK